MLTFEPFGPLFELQRSLDRFASGGGGGVAFLPPADVLVTDDAVTVVMDMPGLQAEDLDIQLHEDELTIRGERHWPYARAEGDGNGNGGGAGGRAMRRIERGFGRFERTLRIPAGLDADAITAALDNGVLTLSLPKPAERRPHKIAVSGGGQHELEAAAN